MAIFFDDTISGETSNSYSSVEDYNQYRENMGKSVLSESEAQIALIKSTAWIDLNYQTNWATYSKAVSTQRLHFPQSESLDSDGTALPDDEIPEKVKIAVYEYAIRAEEQSTLDPASDENIKVATLDTLEVEYFAQKKDGSLPSDFAFIDQIMAPFIVGKTGGSGLQERF